MPILGWDGIGGSGEVVFLVLRTTFLSGSGVGLCSGQLGVSWVFMQYAYVFVDLGGEAV